MKFDDNESWRYSRWEGGSAGGCHAMTLPQTRDAPPPPSPPSSFIHHPPTVDTTVHQLRLYRTFSQSRSLCNQTLSASLPSFDVLPPFLAFSTRIFLSSISSLNRAQASNIIYPAGRAADGEAAWSSVARAPGVPLDCQSRAGRREGSAPLPRSRDARPCPAPLHPYTLHRHSLASIASSALDNTLLSFSHKYICFNFTGLTDTCCSSY